MKKSFLHRGQRTYPQLRVEIHRTRDARFRPWASRGDVFHESTSIITTTRVQILFLEFIFCEICCGCEKDRCSSAARLRGYPQAPLFPQRGSRLWPLYFAEKRVQYASGTDAWEKPCPQQEPYARKANQWNSA
jgi:hypothetical protein